MSSMVEVKTSELIGPALDWAVAYAENVEPFTCGEGRLRSGALAKPWQPSTDWSQGGPLIDKYKASVGPDNLQWSAHAMLRQWTDLRGPTPLIAACRAIVAAKLGDIVQIPQELMQ